MDNIVGIMDMDGFVIERKFYCKELGIIKTGEDEAKTYLFDIGLRWTDLTTKDRKSCVSNETYTQVAVPCLPRIIAARSLTQYHKIIL